MMIPVQKMAKSLINDHCELLLISFPQEKLPNPAHFAFEVPTEYEFQFYLSKAMEMNLNPRSWPAKDSAQGPNTFARGTSTYKIFYVFDPSGVNLEVMVKI